MVRDVEGPPGRAVHQRDRRCGLAARRGPIDPNISLIRDHRSLAKLFDLADGEMPDISVDITITN
jgi:hypothetical protein